MIERDEAGKVEAFADLMRRHRLGAGFTQENLAERAAISARTVSDIERGLRSRVYRDTARRLADALDLDGAERVTFEAAARRGPVWAPDPREVADLDRIVPDLPTPLTRLIGRDEELATIVADLRSTSVRVLTLTGPGGIGKTRLAIEAASRLRSDVADGVWFVSLAVTHDPDLVPSLIGRELGLASVRKPMDEALRDRLHDRAALLVLDTFEHILPAAASLAELAIACPRMTFLVTSRAPLRIRGEHELQLTTLEVPPTAGPVADLERYPAAALFLERVRAIKPGLVLDGQDALSIADICRRLDGLPLALELAAARARHLPLVAIQGALDRRLELLVGGPRDLPPRLQTMRDAVAWSYDLLDEREQRLLRRVSVFAGGWDLSAIEDLSGNGRTEVLAGMTDLIDSNMVATDPRSGAKPRFLMLDIIREFAAEQAEAKLESATLARDHASYFAHLAESAEREQGTSAQESWFERLRLEHDNLLAALAWSVDHDQGFLAQRLAGALWLYWRRHGDYAEARTWLERGLAMPTARSREARALRRKLLWGNAWISYYQGDHGQIRRLGDELLRLATEDEDPVGIRNGLTIQALGSMAEQRFEDAIPLLERGVEICRQHCSPWLLATSLLVLGQATLHGQDQSRCRALLREALSMYRGMGDRLFVARTRGYLGYAALHRARWREARSFLIASLEGFRDLQERFGMAEALRAMSALGAAEGRDEWAATLAGAADALWASMSAQPLAPDRPIAARYLDEARARLGPVAWRSSWERGQTMGSEAAIKSALEQRTVLT